MPGRFNKSSKALSIYDENEGESFIGNGEPKVVINRPVKITYSKMATYFIGFIIVFVCFHFVFVKVRQIYVANSYHSHFQNYVVPRYQIHKYWSLKELNPARESINLEELLTMRSHVIYNQKEKRDDFKVEKNKCYMNNFFEKNNVRYSPVVGRWDSKQKMLEDLEKNFTDDDFPLVFKFCHLTQGSQRSIYHGGTIGNTYFVASKSNLKSVLFLDFVKTGWDLVPEDPERAWTKYMEDALKTLTVDDKIEIFAQSAWPKFPDTKKPLEFKIDVIWGNAYYGRFETQWGPACNRIMFLPQWSYDIIDWNYPLWDHCPLKWEIPNLSTHLKYATKLAERDARILKIDFMRVDVFLNPDDPTKPGINEHSIFEMPGMMRDHGAYFAEEWKKGYENPDLKIVFPDVKSYNMKETLDPIV